VTAPSLELQPRIALVTPCMNQAAFVGETIRSVLGQNYPRLEYAVVDGGSTDGSAEIIERHAGSLSWWCSEKDDGMYDALNKGFSRTNAEIMGWLNSDDLHFPWTLRTVGEIFGTFADVEWLSSLSVSAWNPEGNCIGTTQIAGYSREAFDDGGYLPGGARHYGWIPQEGTFWRRSLWEKAGSRMDATRKLAGDFELWRRFFEHAELVGTPAPLGGFRVQPSQKSRAMTKYLDEARSALVAADERTAHGGGTIRRWLLGLRVADVPGLRGPCSRRYGYEARRVVANAEAGWELEGYRFL
jgi:hypothetical protein